MSDWPQLLRLPGASRDRLQRLLVTRQPTLTDQLWANPWKTIEQPDRWQAEVLTGTPHNWLLLASRQVGKTETISAKACWELLCCGSFVLVVSASEDQAFEFHDRVMEHYRLLTERYGTIVETVKENESELRLENGARLLCLPNNERTVRVYAKVDLLIIDEASRVPDALFKAVRPMLAVSKGRTCCLTTPFGKRGFFWKEWSQGQGWHRKEVPWYKCSRLERDFIESERLMLGKDDFEQEYECRFHESVGGVFDLEGLGECAVVEEGESSSGEDWGFGD